MTTRIVRKLSYKVSTLQKSCIPILVWIASKKHGGEDRFQLCNPDSICHGAGSGTRTHVHNLLGRKVQWPLCDTRL